MSGALRVLFGTKPWKEAVLERLNQNFFEPYFLSDDSNLRPSDFDIYIPQALEDYDCVWADAVQDNCIIPTREVVELADHKLNFSHQLIELGFQENIPEFGIKKSFPMRKIYFPFMLKHPYGEFGKTTILIEDDEDIKKHNVYHRIKKEGWYAQAYTPGSREYTSHFLVKDGHICYQKTLRFDMELGRFVRGQKHKPKRTHMVENTHLELFEQILKSLKYTGTCCFNYKVVEGVPKIFEMNPRFGSTLTLDINNYLMAYWFVLNRS